MAAQRLGWEFDFYAGRSTLAAHFYCSLCGKFHPTFRLGWKTRPNTYSGTHGSGAEMLSVLDPAVKANGREERGDWLHGGQSVRKFGPRR